MDNQPLDLNKMDYKAIRLRLRKRLLKWSAVPLGIVFLVALWCVLPHLLTRTAINSYESGAFAQADSKLRLVRLINSPEQYITLYNSGTIHAQLQAYDEAEAELTKALAYAPADKICMIRQNLVLSFEAHGDYSLRESRTSQAITHYAKALAAIEARPNCFDGRPDKERIDQKKKDAEERQSQNNQTDQSDKSTSNEGNQPNEEQLRQLERQEQAGAQRQKEFNQNSNRSDQFVDKPW